MTVFKVLLVEDHPFWQKILADEIHSALKGIGHPEDIIKVVKTFDEAYQALEESHWHLLITDIGLGDFSVSAQKLGTFLVKRAQKLKIPAIGVSGTPLLTHQNVRDLILKYGVSDFFSKRDFDSNQFITKVQELLQKAVQTIEPNTIKILFLASDPSDGSRLRLGQELRDIKLRLQLAKQPEKFLLEHRWSVRVGDISQSILDVEPHIVHFSGHGMNTGELCFENESGTVQPVKPDALADLFALVNEQVNCVILNACYSETQAEAIAKHIPFVIGMNQAIGDQAAIAFVVGFYKALSANRSIEKAYKFGCAEIKLQGIAEHLTPIICKKHQFE